MCDAVLQPRISICSNKTCTTSGIVGRISGDNLEMAGKPVILPEVYTHDGSWDKWLNHFDNVTCKWTAEQKLPWLKVRLTGRAQKAFKQLPEGMQADYWKLSRHYAGALNLKVSVSCIMWLNSTRWRRRSLRDGPILAKT